MKLSLKKSFSMMMLVFMIAFAFAVPAFAASESYEFYYGGSSSSPYNSHLNGFIVGDADVTGTTVTITLSGEYYDYLNAESGSGLVYGILPTIDANGDSVFTLTNSNPTADIEIELFVNVPGQHASLYPITIHWN
jgi:hypothetical protein